MLGLYRLWGLSSEQGVLRMVRYCKFPLFPEEGHVRKPLLLATFLYISSIYLDVLCLDEAG